MKRAMWRAKARRPNLAREGALNKCGPALRAGAASGQFAAVVCDLATPREARGLEFGTWGRLLSCYYLVM